MKNMKKLLLIIFVCVCAVLNSSAQNNNVVKDSIKTYANGILYYPDGHTVTVESYINWINTIQDQAIRIAKKEELMELLNK